MPIGIVGSLLICTVLYIIVSAVMIGLVDYKLLKDAAAPLATAIDEALKAQQGTTMGVMGTVLGLFARYIIKIGAVLGLSSTMVVMMMGQPRVFYSMAKDGLLPLWAAKIHPKYQTPYITTLITGIIVSIMAGVVPISVLGELVSIGTLFAFVIVAIGVMVMRKNAPDLPRAFKVPAIWIIAPLSAITSLILMASLPWDTWARLIVWMLIGLVIYFGYSMRHSNLNKPEAGSAAE